MGNIFNSTKNEKIKLLNNEITFLNKNFQAKDIYEKHFLNIYKVYDEQLKNYKNIKIMQMTNDSLLKTKVLKVLQSMSSMINEHIINIANYYYDEHSNNQKNIKLILVENLENYITLNDFLLMLLKMNVNKNTLVTVRIIYLFNIRKFLKMKLVIYSLLLWKFFYSYQERI